MDNKIEILKELVNISIIAKNSRNEYLNGKNLDMLIKVYHDRLIIHMIDDNDDGINILLQDIISLKQQMMSVCGLSSDI